VSRRWALAVVLFTAVTGCSDDADGDGYGPDVDCDDGDPTVHPGGVEYWDHKDNDCDGVVDVSAQYRWWDEREPNDALFDDCYRGEGQWLGTLAPTGMVSYLDGHVDWVVDEDYDQGDHDCYGFRLQADAVLHVQIEWPEPSADLDFVVWSHWEEEGTQEAFIASFEPTPFQDGGSTDGTLDAEYPVYLWVHEYAGEPTGYRVTLWTSWATTGEER